MHFGLLTASAVVAVPSLPDGSTDPLRCAQDLVLGDCYGGTGFPVAGLLTGRDDRGSTTRGDAVLALALVNGAIGCDAADLLVGRGLVQ